MRLFRILFAPFRILLALIFYPLRARARKNVLKKSGWVELHLEGEIRELPQPSRWPPIVRRLLKREEPRQVSLIRLRKLVDELVNDPYAKGVLVKLAMIGGGWAGAMTIREQLLRLKSAGKKVIVHLDSHAGNREYTIACAATEISMTPSGAIAAVGSSSSRMYWKNTLALVGVVVEVAKKGLYKSAPEGYTSTERSDPDREQSQAMVDAFDGALIEAVRTGRNVDDVTAKQMIDHAPVIGSHARTRGYVDQLRRDEDLADVVEVLVPAGRYIDARAKRKIIRRRERKVGIVEAHGAIVDRASPYGGFDRFAVEATVVADLRSALQRPDIAAVVLHVDSRGGSVTASDAIWSAVKRVDKEKPVIALFGDVSASGGYYIGCGARAIVCSPLTVTGSIGVFAMYPTWRELAAKLDVRNDVIKNRLHAALFDPWRGIDDEARSHAHAEVLAMYETFLEIVAQARKRSLDEIRPLAEGHVYTGQAAHEIGLVDGLGGMPEAISRAQEAAGGRVASEPILVHARGPLPRPDAKIKETKSSLLMEVAQLLAARTPSLEIAMELASLALTNRSPIPIVAYDANAT